MDEQREIQAQFRQQQEKLTYYIIALCVSAIGFSLYNTMGRSLNWLQLPLGIAILSWATSIYLGITAIKYRISSLFANNVLFDIGSGHHPEVGDHPEKKAAAHRGVMEALKHNSNRAKSKFLWQERLFYVGMFHFIVWHILEMAKNTA